jgi:DNA repair protein RadC
MSNQVTFKSYTVGTHLKLVKEPTTIQNVKITSSRHAEEYLRKAFENEDLDLDYKESFFIILMNRANNTFGYSKISEGGISGTVADGKVIFSNALKSPCSAIILCHNHPSGQLRPSDEDVKLTKKLVEFGKMIDLPILDHIILTEEGYYSFADNGQI